MLVGKVRKRRCAQCQRDLIALARLRPISPAKAEAFWTRVKRGEGCWEWQGEIAWTGYGRWVVSRVHWAAHRLAYTLANGPIPDGQIVCHSCDNRRCVRPDHLWLGTYSDNIQDALRKGRMATGDRHWTRRDRERARAIAAHNSRNRNAA